MTISITKSIIQILTMVNILNCDDSKIELRFSKIKGLELEIVLHKGNEKFKTEINNKKGFTDENHLVLLISDGLYQMYNSMKAAIENQDILPAMVIENDQQDQPVKTKNNFFDKLKSIINY